MTLDDIRRPCAFCDSKPRLQQKGTRHRYRLSCPGHHTGRWQPQVCLAVLAWNHSQETKYYTIRRFRKMA